MGVWILTQMKRWGYIEGDIDYKAVAEQVYLASDARKIMTDLGYDALSRELQVSRHHGQDLRSGNA